MADFNYRDAVNQLMGVLGQGNALVRPIVPPMGPQGAIPPTFSAPANINTRAQAEAKVRDTLAKQFEDMKNYKSSQPTDRDKYEAALLKQMIEEMVKNYNSPDWK